MNTNRNSIGQGSTADKTHDKRRFLKKLGKYAAVTSVTTVTLFAVNNANANNRGNNSVGNCSSQGATSSGGTC